MGKGIVVTWEGKTSTFGLERLERSKLYGARKRVQLDPDGKPCGRASLLEDGQVLLRAGMTAQGYFDDDGKQVDSADLGAIDAEGHELALVPSTLGEPQPLAQAAPTEVLDLSLSAVYLLSDDAVDGELSAALAGGAVFRAPFNYRPDYRPETVFLVRNDAGVFALVGTPSPATWLEPAAPPPAEAEADDEGELDFEMF